MTARAHTQALENLGDEDAVATGCRREFIFRGRLGLSPDMHGLIDEEPRVPLAQHATTGSPSDMAWRNYTKSVLHKGFMYQISEKPDTYIYVSENKTLAGKEDKALVGEATGRKLVVSFFGAPRWPSTSSRS